MCRGISFDPCPRQLVQDPSADANWPQSGQLDAEREVVFALEDSPLMALAKRVSAMGVAGSGVVRKRVAILEMAEAMDGLSRRIREMSA